MTGSDVGAGDARIRQGASGSIEEVSEVRAGGLGGFCKPVRGMGRRSLALGVVVVLGGGCSAAHEASTRPPRPSVVAGVQLVAVGAGVRRDCQTAANWLGYGVPCPRLLPLGSKPTPLPCIVASCRRFIAPGTATAAGVRWAFGSIDFPTALRVGHLVVEASPRPESVAPFIYVKPVSGVVGVVHVVRTLRVGRRVCQVVLVPHTDGGAFAGHTVVVWTAGGHTYGLGFHEHDRGALALDVAVVRSLVLVRPAAGVHHPAPWELAPAGRLRAPRATSRKLVAGVELVAAAAVEHSDCRRAASKVGFPVPCPTMLPAGSRPSKAICMGFDWTAYETVGCGPLAAWASGAIDYPTQRNSAGRLFVLADVGDLAPRTLIANAIRLLEPRQPQRAGTAVRTAGHWVSVSPSGAGPLNTTTFIVWEHTVTGALGGTYTYGLGIRGHGDAARTLLTALRWHTTIAGG